MATVVVMPKVGISVETCILTKWHKNKGDSVKTGDVLFTYETDKASVDEDAKEDGVLLEIIAQEGDDVPVLEDVCIIGQPGEDISALLKSAPAQAAAPAEAKAEEAAKPAVAVAAVAAATPVAEGGKIKVSPRAKALAAKSGIDLRLVGGSGPDGRIIERDIRTAIESGVALTSAALASGQSASGVAGTGIGGRVTVGDLSGTTAAPASAAAPTEKGEVEIVKFSNIRKVIAKSMLNSLSSMAQLTNNGSFDATNIMQYRSMLKANEEMGLSGITFNDIILYAVSRTLKNHRDLNAHLIGDEMHYYNSVHLGIAVDTPRGLLVPTLFNADKMSLLEISVNAKKIIKEAQAGSISPDLLQGATFTISNLGTLGVESFTPVINPPQTGLLGVCSIVDRIKVVNGEIKAYPSMGLSLTYDHRAVDGAPAGRFVMELKKNLENFTALLAK